MELGAVEGLGVDRARWRGILEYQMVVEDQH